MVDGVPVTTSTLLYVIDRMPGVKSQIQQILQRADCTETQKVEYIARLLQRAPNAIRKTSSSSSSSTSASSNNNKSKNSKSNNKTTSSSKNLSKPQSKTDSTTKK